MFRESWAGLVRSLLLMLLLGFYLFAMRRLWSTLLDKHFFFGAVIVVCVVGFLAFAWTKHRAVGVVMVLVAHFLSGMVGGISGGQTWFLVFGVVVDVNARRPWRTGVGLSALVAVSAVVESGQHGGVPWVIMWVLVMTLFGQFIADRNRTIEKLKRLRQREQALERLKLAAAMHDEVASSLSQGLVVLRALRTATLSDDQHHKLLQVEQALTRSSTALRKAIWGLKGNAPGAVSVPVLLHEQARALQAAGFAPTLVTEGDWPTSDGHDRLWLALIQEATANVLQHAPAGSEVRISATAQETQLRLTMENSVEMGVLPAPGNDNGLCGNGLANLSQRVGAAGGTLQVGRNEGFWQLTAVVPTLVRAEG